MRDYNFYVYILTNWNDTVMYIGMTNNLRRRLYEHKNKLVEGFTKKYNVHKLVYYEHGNDAHAAIAREKEIKKWRREKKNNLVVTMNPEWKDLSVGWEVPEISPFGRNDKGQNGRNNKEIIGRNDKGQNSLNDEEKIGRNDKGKIG